MSEPNWKEQFEAEREVTRVLSSQLKFTLIRIAELEKVLKTMHSHCLEEVFVHFHGDKTWTDENEQTLIPTNLGEAYAESELCDKVQHALRPTPTTAPSEFVVVERKELEEMLSYCFVDSNVHKFITQLLESEVKE